MKVFAATGALVLASLTAVSAHGNIVDPAAVWTQGYPSNGYISEVNNTLWGPMDGSKYGYGPSGAIKYFSANFPDSGVTTLRDLILENQDMYADTIDKNCGYTIKDDAKRATMPAGSITFSGFSHPGPCELWCDENKIAYDVDCSTKYPTGKVPYDASKCAGANQFTIYWLAVHGSPWQVYTNCVYLKGGSASAGSSTVPKAATAAPKATTTAPKATTAAPKATTAPKKTTAPKATTAAPVADDADDEYATDAPATSAPAAASTPSPTKKKCTAKARRV